jgi:glycosyltransferase involved in cell wall biosynthesis
VVSIISTPVSVLILTRNEESNIARCLDSVAWSDDVVVLDSGSTDRTVEIAISRGARVLHRPFDDFATQRNFGMQSAELKHDWVLHLDADEVVPAALAKEIATTISDSPKDAYRLASKLMFMDRWLRFSGMYPVYQVRLGHKDKLRFRQSGHGQREISENLQLGTLREPYQHFNFSKGLSDWIERHNRYSTEEAMMELRMGEHPEPMCHDDTGSASMRRRRLLKRISTRLPFRPTMRFVYMYILRLGFLDGRPGWVYCRLMAGYESWIVLKRRELVRRRSMHGVTPVG